MLEQFVTNGNEAAFERLLERHGPMVWSVCRRVLRDHHDAEEAFQAAFLVLARKAGTVEPPESVGNWLYGVASRTALKLRAVSARRQAKERLGSGTPEVGSLPDEAKWELAAVLDEELGRLPDRFRAAVVICDLQGRTRSEAARQLGWARRNGREPAARGRTLLAGRLTRRGVTLTAGSLALEIAKDAGASIPQNLTAQTVKVASLLVLGQVPAGLISSQVLSLADWAVKVAGLKKSLALVIGLGARPGRRGNLLPGARHRAAARASDEAGREGRQPQGGASHARRERALERVVKSVPEVEDLEQRVWLLCEVARLQGQAGLDEAQSATLEKAVRAADDAESDHRKINVAVALASAGRLRERSNSSGRSGSTRSGNAPCPSWWVPRPRPGPRRGGSDGDFDEGSTLRGPGAPADRGGPVRAAGTLRVPSRRPQPSPRHMTVPSP